ncbi:(2Fe-2S)-binding protein [Pseudonocardia sulfidoxydans NBRC 16205]|uniref:(2Fe-2S)-binding protein n=1 Tax=Pseudonocardia sulfidoxydans NBRC 16205 TaxID=1223511 RepID=A0A511DC86_9PSEU|nr:(2Fe-2S)-binding protein [Pseudonocardia sulfidoxydans]GEL22415.1 (2Fe-2S)-binding protein [Pseudonocardia sulfidoxydans NBRC 16205]
MGMQRISVNVNGADVEARVEPRLLLSDFIRHDAGLTGTHVGCEHGVCGACTVEVDGAPARSCLMFAVQVEGAVIRTVEGLTASAGPEGWSVLQQSLHEHHGLQCGFCTPGILMSLQPLLTAEEDPDETQIREALAGNLCRCTGYENIVNAVMAALAQVRSSRAA